MARMAGDLLMPEKSAAWLEAECLRRCRLLADFVAKVVGDSAEQ